MSEWYRVDSPATPPGQQGPFKSVFLCKDTTPDDDAGDSIPVIGAEIGQMMRLWRVIAVLRKTISADFVAAVDVIYSTGATHQLLELTVPSSTTTKRSVEFLAPDFDWSNLPDKAVLVPRVVSSDGQKDKNGVVSITLVYRGRGSGLPTDGGALGDLAEWAGDSTYATGDLVTKDGIWKSRVDSNTGNDPTTSPTQWDLIVPPGPAGTVAIGTVTTGAAGSSASVTNVGTDSAAILDFAIPRGNTGATGSTGATGPAGPAIVTTKGDLATFDTAVARLAVGTNGQVLEADSAQSKGIKWADPSGKVQLAGSLIGTEKILNFIAGLGVTLSVVDDSGSGRVNITINATGGGGGGGSSASGSGGWVVATSGGAAFVW